MIREIVGEVTNEFSRVKNLNSEGIWIGFSISSGQAHQYPISFIQRVFFSENFHCLRPLRRILIRGKISIWDLTTQIKWNFSGIWVTAMSCNMISWIIAMYVRLPCTLYRLLFHIEVHKLTCSHSIVVRFYLLRERTYRYHTCAINPIGKERFPANRSESIPTRAKIKLSNLTDFWNSRLRIHVKRGTKRNQKCPWSKWSTEREIPITVRNICVNWPKRLRASRNHWKMWKLPSPWTI